MASKHDYRVAFLIEIVPTPMPSDLIEILMTRLTDLDGKFRYSVGSDVASGLFQVELELRADSPVTAVAAANDLLRMVVVAGRLTKVSAKLVQV